MTGAELEAWVCDRASAIVESGEDLLPVVWSLTPDGNPVGVFITSRSGLRLRELIEPAASVARVLGTAHLVLVSEGYVRRYVGGVPDDLPAAAEDPESAPAIVAYQAEPGALRLRTRECHRDDGGRVTLARWETRPLTSGPLHDLLRTVVEVGGDAALPASADEARVVADRFGLVVTVFERAGGEGQ